MGVQTTPNQTKSNQRKLLTSLAIWLWSSGNKVKNWKCMVSKTFHDQSGQIYQYWSECLTSLKYRPIRYQSHGLVLFLSHLARKGLNSFMDLASLNLAHCNIHWQNAEDPKQSLRYYAGLSVYPDFGSTGHICYD